MTRAALLLVAVLAGCYTDLPICEVARDDEPLIVFREQMPDAFCSAVRFPKFIEVNVKRGDEQWLASVDFDDEGARTSTVVIWNDARSTCGQISAIAVWTDKEFWEDRGFDFSVEAECGEEHLSARFRGAL